MEHYCANKRGVGHLDKQPFYLAFFEGKTMNRLSNYEEVKDRLPRFWKAVDRGRITTEILNHSDDFSRVVIKASLSTL